MRAPDNAVLVMDYCFFLNFVSQKYFLFALKFVAQSKSLLVEELTWIRGILLH